MEFIAKLKSFAALKLMVAKSSYSWKVRCVSVVTDTLAQAPRLSVGNVSGSTLMPGTLNGNFSQIRESNVENSSAVLRVSSTRTVSFNTSGIWNFSRYVTGHANRLPPRM